MTNSDLRSIYDQFRITPLCIQCGCIDKAKLRIIYLRNGFKIACSLCHHLQQFYKPEFMKGKAK